MNNSSLQTMQDDQYDVQVSPDGRVIRIVKKDYVRLRRRGVGVSWGVLTLLIAGVLFSFFMNTGNDAVSSQDGETQGNQTVTENMKQYDSYLDWKISGFIFPESDQNLITEEEVLAAAERLNYTESEIIQYAINEIYARNHYRFQDADMIQFYGVYDWYEGYLSSEETVSRFNDIEQVNMDKLCELRAKYR